MNFVSKNLKDKNSTAFSRRSRQFFRFVYWSWCGTRRQAVEESRDANKDYRDKAGAGGGVGGSDGNPCLQCKCLMDPRERDSEVRWRPLTAHSVCGCNSWGRASRSLSSTLHSSTDDPELSVCVYLYVYAILAWRCPDLHYWVRPQHKIKKKIATAPWYKLNIFLVKN